MTRYCHHVKEALVRSYETFWQGGDADPQKLTAAAAMADLQPMGDYLDSLDPKTPEQKRAVSAAQAHFAPFEQTRLMISLQLAAPFSRPLLIVVIVWSAFLFCGFGLLSRTNATTLAALAFGAFAVASAIFVILELASPTPASSAPRRLRSSRRSRPSTNSLSRAAESLASPNDRFGRVFCGGLKDWQELDKDPLRNPI